MTPGTVDLTVYKGAKFEHDLELLDEETGLPLDLTGLGPFVATFKQGSTSYNLTVTSSYDNTGLINIKLLAATTNNLTIGSLSFGLRDNQNNPYIESILNVKSFTPTPA